MKRNTKPQSKLTHEGGLAGHENAEQQLRRSVMACLLWEKQFYEDGQTIADRIAALVPVVAPAKVAQIAVEARNDMRLRHVPLLLTREMARHASHRPFVPETLATVIQRADEMAEFLAIYWAGGDRKKGGPLAKVVKRGLAEVFGKFSEYDFSKYKGAGSAVSLRDVMFLVRPKPNSAERAVLYTKIADNQLEAAGTWENVLSDNTDTRSKRDKWEALLREQKMGALAILRNLRNFKEEQVDEAVVLNALAKTDVSKVLPFRFIAAARYAPQWEDELEAKMFESITGKLPGKTVILVDVSGSMDNQLSEKAEMSRLDAAYGVAMIAREMAEQVAIYTFSEKVKLIPSRRGFALRDAMHNSQGHNGTYLGRAIKEIDQTEQYDRLIIITDEQAQDKVDACAGRGYIINVASYENGVNHGSYTTINGWSDAVLRYIVALESEENDRMVA